MISCCENKQQEKGKKIYSQRNNRAQTATSGPKAVDIGDMISCCENKQQEKGKKI